MLSKTLRQRGMMNTSLKMFSTNVDRPDVFMDIKNHGFLPNTKPMQELPKQFGAMNQILDSMTYWQPDGKATGLLAQNKLRSSVDLELPDFMNEIKKVDENDYRLNAALFRDYSMLSSAYLLEECHLNFLKTKNYGIGMDHLPEKLAVPMKFLADRLRYGQPLLEYAYGYALYNWKMTNDPNPESINYKNE